MLAVTTECKGRTYQEWDCNRLASVFAPVIRCRGSCAHTNTRAPAGHSTRRRRTAARLYARQYQWYAMLVHLAHRDPLTFFLTGMLIVEGEHPAREQNVLGRRHYLQPGRI